MYQWLTDQESTHRLYDRRSLHDRVSRALPPCSLSEKRINVGARPSITRLLPHTHTHTHTHTYTYTHTHVMSSLLASHGDGSQRIPLVRQTISGLDCRKCTVRHSRDRSLLMQLTSTNTNTDSDDV
eukprot:GHVU01111430.1.p1 GENE.GHVU01111430.1~~GHVU01111430.1.p1  ORF type:complete len:126 (-),score=3.75 GHVU01111430.1:519-896(-)